MALLSLLAGACGTDAGPRAIEASELSLSGQQLRLRLLVLDAEMRPVAADGGLTAVVMEGSSPVCSFGPAGVTRDMFAGGASPSVVLIGARCPPPADAARERDLVVQLAAGGEPLTHRYPASHLFAPEATPAAAAPAPVTMGTARRPEWPCSSTLTPELGSVATDTYEYGGPDRCTIPPQLGVVGCPTVRRTRMGSGSFDADTQFDYLPDGRLERARRTHPRSGDVELTSTVTYGADGAVVAVDEEGITAPERWSYSRAGAQLVASGSRARA